MALSTSPASDAPSADARPPGHLNVWIYGGADMKQQPTKDQWCLALGELQATFDLLTTLDNADNLDRWMTLDGHIGVD